MTETTLTPEDAEELKLLYQQLSTIVSEVNKILQTAGPDSAAFRKFDQKANSIVRRIQAIQSAGKHWIEI